jgi:ABC-2 type transport system permease protein
LILFLSLLIVGAVLHYTLQMTFVIPVFWMHSSMGLREVLFSMEQYITRPLGIFRGWMARILVSVLPFALIVSFPTRALFQGFQTSLLLHMLGVTSVAFLMMVLLWRRGLRSYTSASS